MQYTLWCQLILTYTYVFRIYIKKIFPSRAFKINIIKIQTLLNFIQNISKTKNDTLNTVHLWRTKGVFLNPVSIDYVKAGRRNTSIHDQKKSVGERNAFKVLFLCLMQSCVIFLTADDCMDQNSEKTFLGWPNLYKIHST